MITLITGTPGTGKTAYVVSEILNLDGTRPVYIHAIPDLKLPHTQIYCRSTLCEPCQSALKPDDAPFVETWPEWAPQGAILVLDEVQRVWRPRGPSAAVPESVAGLETHRHKGLDFFLISQGPHLFDGNVSRLVGRHVHLVAKWAGRYAYEWPECHRDTGSVTGAVKRNYKLPAKVFDLYTSATLHTKQEKKKPLAFYLIFPVIIISVLLSWRVYVRIQKAMHPEPLPLPADTKPTIPTGQTSPVPAQNASTSTFNPTPNFQPRSPGRIESAPAYDGTYAVKEAPLLVAGVYDGTICKLIAKGGRRYPATQEFCIAYVKGDVDYQFEKKAAAAQIKQFEYSPALQAAQ